MRPQGKAEREPEATEPSVRPIRSEGARLLVRVGVTQEAISARTGINRVRIAHYQSGVRKPGPKNRALLGRAYNIPEQSWDQVATSSNGVAPPPASSEGAGESTVLDTASRLRRMVTHMMDQLNADERATPHERAKVMRVVAGTLLDLGKLTGETIEITEAKILRLPAFRRILDVMVGTLKPWPEAMRALYDALRKLGL